MSRPSLSSQDNCRQPCLGVCRHHLISLDLWWMLMFWRLESLARLRWAGMQSSRCPFTPNVLNGWVFYQFQCRSWPDGSVGLTGPWRVSVVREGRDRCVEETSRLKEGADTPERCDNCKSGSANGLLGPGRILVQHLCSTERILLALGR